ncbi:MAG: hypothetical protein C4K49_02975 [Candidatus Thorarchaeota archaeon]|nr:MAG: hypothetical protein C4K49_02975 [Candidatus Thorarchaeota archaeon]
MGERGKADWHNASAIREVASSFGAIVGLAGIEHGCFEVLQGSVATDGIIINAIGPAQTMWEGASERALTIIPNFLVTGLLAIIFGILVTVWAVAFVHRRHGAPVLFLLAIILFLVGGGLAPIILTVVATATATRIDKPLTWWHAHLPHSIGSALARLWPWSLFAFVLVFWGTVGVQIFGSPFGADITRELVTVLSIIMVSLIPLTVVVGLAFDVLKQDVSHRVS